MLIFNLLVIFLINTGSKITNAFSHENDSNTNKLNYIQYLENNNHQFHTSIQFNKKHKCSGSILSKNYVITSANCVSNFFTGKSLPKRNLTILVGTKYPSSSNGLRVGIKKIIIHPQYKYYNNDIAIIKLNKSLDFDASNQIRPIKMEFDNNVPSESEIIVSGWRSSDPDQPLANELMYDVLKLQENEECNRNLNNLFPESFCLKHFNLNKANNICFGEIGSPAVLNGKLIGFLSFLDFECRNFDTNAFTNISYHRNWILNIIK